MGLPAFPLYVAGRPWSGNRDLPVVDKFTGDVLTWVPLADAALVAQAIGAAAGAVREARDVPPYVRREILEHCVRRFRTRAEELAQVLCGEAGKPIRDARGEVTRLIDTFQIAADESVRIGGEVLNLEISSRAHGYQGMTRRFPVGACGLIAPFNFPLNLVAHKVAPAIAAGCPFVLKPASATPLGALIIAEILAETAWPRAAFSVLAASRTAADQLVTDPRLALLSFTGSPQVGWDLKTRAGRKKVVLELGGNAACVIDETADLDDVVPRLVTGAFYQSGQSCISVQRILVQTSIYETLRERLVAATRAVVVGDPRDEQTTVGPLISEDAAERLERWIADAVAGGARVLCGGRRAGVLFEPTLLEQVPPEADLCRQEAFGPVAILSRFTHFDEALRQVNDSVYGLQAGIFTRDLYRAQAAWSELEVGGVIVGDVPSWRVDHMPYGGVKQSGLGREGIRYAIEHFTEPRLLVIRTPHPPVGNP